MKLTVLGSSSAGNGYIIQNDQEAIILECGIHFSEALKALNFNTSKVEGVFVTHEHLDHCKFVKDYQAAGFPLYASQGTIDKMSTLQFASKTAMKEGTMVQVGNFKVKAFNVKHDCAEPLGFLIYHPETGYILFATDTYFLPYKFDKISNWLIECNYRIDILDRNCPEKSFKKILRDRTLESHMSFDVCREALKANDLQSTRNIVLIHLSDSNSNAAEFKREIEKETGKMTHIAQKGLEINLSKNQF